MLKPIRRRPYSYFRILHMIDHGRDKLTPISIPSWMYRQTLVHHELQESHFDK